MATYTTNLNLEKPATSENFNLAKINSNWDKIDAGFGTVNEYGGNLSSGNLNNLTATKIYYLTVSGSFTNHPNPGVPTMLYVVCHNTTADTFYAQFAIQSNKIFYRNKFTNAGSEWSAWQYIQLGGNGWLASGTNINSLTAPGTYGLSGSNSYTGLPTGVTSGILEVIAPAAADVYIIQRLTIASAHYERYRSSSSGSSFGSWYKYTGTAV